MREKNHYAKKLLLNTLVFAIGNFSSRILIFILIPLYTRTLTTIEFGFVDLLNITVTLLLPIFTLNIHEAVLRFALEKNSAKNQVVSIGIQTVIIGFILVGLLSPLFMRFLGTNEYILFFLGTYILTALKNVFTYYARGIEKIRLVVVLGFIETLLLLILNLIFLLILNKGIYGYFYSLILSQILIIITYIILLKIKRSYFFEKNSWHLRKQMFFYALPMVPNSLSWWINNTSDKYILNYFWGVSATGIYAVAYKVPALLNTITKIFMEAWQISAVEEYETNGSKNFSEVYRFYFGINMLVCTGLILFSNFIGRIMFSKEFYGAVKFIPVLLTAYFFNGLAAYLGSIYTASKKTNMLFISTGIGAVVNIILNILLIPKYGGYGAALATLISYFVIWLIRLLNTRNIITLQFNLPLTVFKIIILFFLTIFMSIKITPFTLILLVFFSLIIFISNLFIIKAIFKIIIKKLKKKSI